MEEKNKAYQTLVFLAIIVNNIVCQGFLFGTIGILTTEYPELVGASQTEATSVGSALVSVFLLTLSVSGTLIQFHGCRVVSGVGCAFAVLGYISSAFASQLWHLILGFSIAAGFGLSMNLMSTIAIVPYYFTERQNMAYAASGLGCGIGFTIYPYIYSSIRRSHSYRDTLLYMLPLLVCSISAPILFKHSKPQKKPSLRELFLRFKTCMGRFQTPFTLTNAFFWNSMHVGVTVLLFKYVSQSSSAETAVYVQSVLGASEILGSLMLTIILMKFTINHIILQLTCNSLAGVFCIIIVAVPHVISIYISAAAIGFLHSITISNIACICSHLYPLEEVNNMYCMHQALGAIGSILGPFIAVTLNQTFGLGIGFYYLAACILFGAFVLLLAALIRPKLWHRFDNPSLASTETELSTQKSQPDVRV